MKPFKFHEGHYALLVTMGIAIILLLLTLIQEVRADEHDPVVRCTNGTEVRYFPNYTCAPGWWRV